jgi:hypothetical protein
LQTVFENFIARPANILIVIAYKSTYRYSYIYLRIQKAILESFNNAHGLTVQS